MSKFSQLRSLWHRKLLLSVLIALLAAGIGSTLAAFQGRSFEDDDEAPPLPPGADQKAEWTFARLHFPSGIQYGYYRGSWAADYPKADRQFVMGVKRLTRLHVRGMETVVDLDSDELYNWPWIYMEHAHAWNLNPAQAARLRDYLLRGGFLMADDTHGDYEWDAQLRGLEMVFPDRPIEELSDKDEIFHTMYDLDERFQIDGTRYIWGGRQYTPDMLVAKWRGIRDDKGRIMIAICHNSDVGDAWEWADSPHYPERETSLAYRIGIDYILYDMTH